MAWCKRLLDLVPDSPQGVGTAFILLGWLGCFAALRLGDTPLCLGAFVLYAVGIAGPRLHALKKRRHAPPTAEADTAEEDAAVDAFLRLVDGQYRPGRDRLH